MIKLGIIGFGGMASYHEQNLKEYKRVEVAGIYDVDPARMAYAKSLGYKTYKDQRSMLEDLQVDAILIGTTNEVHKEIAIQGMRAGKHIICEKPVTLSSEDLIEIMAVEKETGQVFTINQNRRTNRDFVLMRRQVEAGLLGDVYHFESRVEGSRGMPKGWRTIKALGGGMMLDWGVHLIDQMLYMLEDEVVNIYCQMNSIEYPDVDDNFRLALTFKSGKTLQLEVATNNYVKHPRWYVLGTEGTLQIDDWECDGKIVHCKDKDGVWEDEIVYTKAGPTKVMAPRRKDTLEEITLSEPLDVVDNITVVYDQFIDAIEGNGPLTITSAQALRVMQVMEAAFESAETGCAIASRI